MSGIKTKTIGLFTRKLAEKAMRDLRRGKMRDLRRGKVDTDVPEVKSQ